MTQRWILWTSGVLIALSLGCSNESTGNSAGKTPTNKAGTSARPASQAPNNAGAAGSSATLPTSDTPATPADSDPTTPLTKISTSCKGFEVVGLTHSPGGDVLPNKCAPFHGTLNNPYAIRCVDANPDYKTQWIGDEYCILPPPADKGTQLYVGPKSYTNPADYQEYVIDPGTEINTIYYAKAGNDDTRYYYRANWRMRDGSHHMLVYLLDTDHADGWASQGSLTTDVGVSNRSFGGTQRPDADRPQGTLDIPPENDGLGADMRPRQQFSFNLHHMNRFNEPILREAWLNVWYLDGAPSKPMQNIAVFGNPADLQIPNGEHRYLHYKTTASADLRIVSLWGHRHANTDRFGMWVQRATGEKFDIYESFDYTDMPNYQYDTISTNPVANVDSRIDGASSGMLELSQGDELHFVCDITNQSGVTLKFANQLKTGEMCIVFGARTGDGSLGAATRVND